MIRRLLCTAVACGTIFGAAGCRHNKCCSKSPCTSGQQFLPPPPGAAPSTIPPTALPTMPNAGTLPPVGVAPAPQPEFLQPRPGNYGPPPVPAPAPAPAPAKPQPEILLPDPLPGGPSSRSAYPQPPGNPPFLSSPAAPKPVGEPPLAAKPAPVVPPAPTFGLPAYTRIREGVATGRKPALDGFDSLKSSGYRTVAYLHPAGADLGATRDLAEARGFRFVGIETTPETLPEAAKHVNQLVADRDGQPVYVFDDDGLRTGAVWYLHFRTVDAQPSDTARIRASAIGLNDSSDEGRAFWVAIQRLLEK